MVLWGTTFEYEAMFHGGVRHSDKHMGTGYQVFRMKSNRAGDLNYKELVFMSWWFLHLYRS